MNRRGLIAALAAIYFASGAAAQGIQSSQPHRHPMLKALGASQPISDRHAACLIPVDEALTANVALLTTLRFEDVKNADKQLGARFKPISELLAAYRADIEIADWAPRPQTMRADRQAALQRQKEAHGTLLATVLARGENIMAGMALDQRRRTPVNEAEQTRIEGDLHALEDFVEMLDDEILKLATVARYTDATVIYYDCELARTRRPSP